MKKLLAFLLIVCTLVACMAVGAFAADYKQGDTLEKNYPAIWQFTFEPTDITGAVSIKFDIWIEDVSRIKFDELEFGSLAQSDWQEKAYNPASEKMGIANLKSGEWGTVTMKIADGADVNAEVESVLKNVGDAPKGFDMTHFCRIRLFTLASYDKTLVKIRNIVAVKEDGTEIKVGAEPVVTDIVPTIEVLSAEWTGEHDWTITFKATGLDHPDFKGDAWVGVYPSSHTSNSYSVADSMQTWRYLNEGRAAPTDPLNVAADNTMTVTYTFETNLGNADICAPKEGVDYDLVLFFNDSGYDYVCRDSFRFNAEPETPDTPDTPTTFDAVSSVAVAAVAALGVALVASKKRH